MLIYCSPKAKRYPNPNATLFWYNLKVSHMKWKNANKRTKILVLFQLARRQTAESSQLARLLPLFQMRMRRGSNCQASKATYPARSGMPPEIFRKMQSEGGAS